MPWSDQQPPPAVRVEALLQVRQPGGELRHLGPALGLAGHPAVVARVVVGEPEAVAVGHLVGRHAPGLPLLRWAVCASPSGPTSGPS